MAPSDEERRRLGLAVDYLIRETTRWPWLSAEQKKAIRAEYSRRRQRLAGETAPDARSPMPVPPAAQPSGRPGTAPAAPLPLPTAARVAPPEPGPTGSPPSPPTARALSAFLEEANIRWLLLLGGLLLASAGIGLLYSQWNTHGRTIAGLSLLAAPVLCFWTSVKIRASLPLSSRILALLGGLLLPTSLVAVRLFELGGLRVPWPPWNLAVFLLSSMVLLAMAQAQGETCCLYLGSLGLTAAAAALAVWTGHPPAFGLSCLVIASLWLAAARTRNVSLAPFRSHFFGLSQALAGLGLLSTLPAFLHVCAGPPLADLGLLLLGAAFFVGSAVLSGSRQGVLWSAPAALAAVLLHALRGDAPTIHLGYGLVALGLLYGAGSGILRRQKGLEQAAGAALFVGTTLVGLPLALLLACQLLEGLTDNFASTPVADLRSAALIALAAAALYGVAATTCATPRLMYASTAALAYTWFLGSVLWHREIPGRYGLDMSLLPLAWVALAWLLRRTLAGPVLTRLVQSALVLACLPAPINLAMRALHLPAAEPSAPLTLMVTALTLTLATPWLRSASLLYPAALCGCLAYALGLPWLLEATGLPSDSMNHGLAFLPLLAGLALTALRLGSSAGQAYALPVARVTLWITVGLAAWQLNPALSTPALASLTLALYALALAAFAWPFRAWPFMGTTGADLLSHLAALAVPAALWVAGGHGGVASQAGLLAFAVATLALDWFRTLPATARRALSRASQACGPVIILTGPQAAGPNPALQSLFANAPALLWLAHSWQSGRPGLLVGLSAMMALTGAGIQGMNGQPHLGHTLPGLIGVSALACGYALLGYRERPVTSLLPAWLFAAASCDGAWHLLKLSAEARIWLWGLFWLLVCAAVTERRRRSNAAGRTLEVCAQISACALLGRATLASGSTFLGVDLLVATVLLFCGWRRPQPVYFAFGWGLLALAPLQAELQVLGDGPLPGRAATLMAVLVAAAAGLGPYARSRDRGFVAESLAPLARATAFGAVLFALTDRHPGWALAGLTGTALALWLQAALARSQMDWHLGFAAAYAAYATQLDRAGLSANELWLAPPALWLLLWGERYRARGARPVADVLAATGVGLLLVPPFLATVTGTAVGHTVFLVVASLALLLAGLGRRHRIHAVGASLALLGEVGLQALHLAARVPWWYVALAAGILLVSLGIVFEKRRADLLRAGQNLLQEVARW